MAARSLTVALRHSVALHKALISSRLDTAAAIKTKVYRCGGPASASKLVSGQQQPVLPHHLPIKLQALEAWAVLVATLDAHSPADLATVANQVPHTRP